MDGKEFKKYAVKHHGIGSLRVEDYMKLHQPNMAYQGGVYGLTPNVIEERQLNVQAIDVFSRLMMDRLIWLGMPIYDNVANIIQAQLLFLESTDPTKDINIYINSPGGSVYAGLGIYDTMQYVRSDVSTICTGMAASMAAVLLAAGADGKRSGLEHCRVMIHQPMSGTQGQVSDMEIAVQETIKVRDELYKIIARHSGQTPEKIKEDSDRDYWMSSDEAKEYGMIDEVLRKQDS